MKLHVDLGYRTLCQSKSDLLNLAATIARTHHEKYDGSGYTAGLSASKSPWKDGSPPSPTCLTPLASHRVYKQALPIENVVAV